MWNRRHLLFTLSCTLLTVSAFGGCAQLPKPYEPTEPTPKFFLYQDHVRIYYQDVGRGEPLVLIHGFGETSATWRQLVPELARHYRVVTLDLKGVGYSDKPDDGRYRIADQAEIVTALVQALKFENMTLVGHSLGGGVALMAVLHWQAVGSGRLKRLVLIDSAGLPTRIPRLIAMLRMPLIGPMMLYLSNPTILARQILTRNYFDPTLVSDELIDAYARSMRSPGGRRALLETARQIVPEELAEISVRYPTLSVPTLVIWCQNDPVLPPFHAKQFHDVLPNARVALLPACGHSPQEERPAETLQAMERFFASESLSDRTTAPR